MATANKRRFTEEMLRRLKSPATGRLELGDVVVPGLIVRVTSQGRKSFSVIYKVPGAGEVSPRTGRRLAGRQQRITLGQYPIVGLSEARQRARSLLEVVSEGRDPAKEQRAAQEAREANSVEAVARKFMAQDTAFNERGQLYMRRTLELHVFPDLGETPIRDVRRSDLHELLDKVVAETGRGAARETQKHMSRFFNWAADREIIESSPMNRMRRADLAPNKDAGRALSNDEIKAIWHGAGDLGYPFAPWYRLLLLTGRRRIEWSAARRSEIDIEERLHILPPERHKSGRGHALPLSAPAWAIVESLPVWPGNDYYLFSTTGGEKHIKGYSQGKRLLDAAALMQLRDESPDSSLPPYRVHDFRVTTETRLAALGFSPDVFGAVLGHSKQGLQRTYNKHDYMAEKREAMAAYSQHIMEIVG